MAPLKLYCAPQSLKPGYGPDSIASGSHTTWCDAIRNWL